MTTLVRVENLRKYFPVSGGWLGGRKGWVHAVDGVSLDVLAGETLGLVGESGCGKSTLARCVVRLAEPDSGRLEFDGQDITHRSMREMKRLRRDVQLIFQDPYASLNPRKRIRQILAEALRLRGTANASTREAETVALLKRVGLPAQFMDRMPRDLSGGQRQRVGIARALAAGPRLVVADEPVSALDVSVQADILNLIKDLQRELGLTVLFISHDLGVIRHVSDRVGVMYLGRLVELAPAEAFYEAPLHPYSEALLSAIPVPDPDARLTRKEIVLEGDVPNPIAPPPGCRFHTRCPYARDICATLDPQLVAHGGGRAVACHFPLAGAPGGDQAQGAAAEQG
jgi:oligopeptide/dipeptide ABC transporter ATP-binding protein